MTKYREHLKVIIQILSYGLVYLLISYVKNPIASCTALGILILLVLYEIYVNLRYRRGNAKYILFPTMNDDYSKTSAVILGALISCLSFGVQIYWDIFNEYIVFGITLGILVLINGLLNLPNGRLKIKANLIEVSGVSAPIDQNELKEIHISKEQLLLIPFRGETKRVPNLDLDVKSAQLIQDYISTHQTNPELTILNRLT